MEAVTGQEVVSTENLYRTKWLMAHNRLHEIVHGETEKPLADLWKEYLDELQLAEAIAATSA